MTTATGRAYVISRLQRAATLKRLAEVWDTVADDYRRDEEVKRVRLAMMKRLK